ncbi:DUF4221 domain-containing protein [Algoriphagus halophytocola]|uniref:DUF4221 domain-containing protein n=1 Tax=Algoriphagus halophytocola TaxID=2991499 RepID=A0ABY6MFA1_9BACT|nr:MULTISPECIES: DUF4221 domain-containing protein [unclassified Algoriphagus]UZD21629.1 DUF4221 domain-containing protein [Algoriphagus sp. TR-M5]WBL42841.1 DUF4221 domain-containing protein [Algoriphagus sp. TR-M9]
MKKLLTISFLSLLAACGGKESDSTEQKNILEDLTYSVDTVVVNPGENIIDLSHGSRFSSVSLDEQKFYHYDYRMTAINEIDLQKLELTDRYQFSKEGPNSIGFNPPTIQPLSSDRFLFVSSGINVGTYFKSGEQEKNLKFNFKEIDGLDLDEGGLITYQAHISPDEKHLFALTSPYKTSSDVRLIIINPETKTGKSISLPAMVSTLKFRVSLQSGKNFRGRGEAVNLNVLNNKLFITSSANSDAYVYDYQSDSLSLFEFPHQLVSPRKLGEIKQEVSDGNEFNAETAKFIYQTSFDKFLWDKKRQQHFRLGYKLIPQETPELEKKSEVFLFAYDKDLNLLGEKQLDQIDNRLESPFFKDGKLYSFVNVEDELGFAVFTFDF